MSAGVVASSSRTIYGIRAQRAFALRKHVAFDEWRTRSDASNLAFRRVNEHESFFGTNLQRYYRTCHPDGEWQ